ncbi:MAG: cupin domain-containing protein [Armatimonadota bacterium]|nr:cupin domain-containing protein [Armatimonadota bacterium]
MRLQALDALSWEDVYPGVRRRVVGAAHMTLTVYRFAPAARFPTHRHAQEQVVLVCEGAVTFASGAQAVTVTPGHVLVIAPGVPHEATAGPEGASLVSVVSPARQTATDYVVEESR